MTKFRKLLTYLILALSAQSALLSPAHAVERFRPFVLAWRGHADFQTRVAEVRQALESAGFDIVADFSPYPEDAYLDELRILVFTSGELKRLAARSRYGGFATAQRVSISRHRGDVQVAYVNPTYMAHAYRLSTDLKGITDKLAGALGRVRDFGSEKGLTEKHLRTYRYTFGMEYFDEPYELASFANHEQALREVTRNLAAATGLGITPVYRIDIPGKDETIIGVTRRGRGKEDRYYDDHWIMDNVDFGELHTTAYLPYEVMVTGNRVIAMSMRFRMAVYHPDLSMKGRDSFMNIIPSPLAVKNVLGAAVTGNLAANITHK